MVYAITVIDKSQREDGTFSREISTTARCRHLCHGGQTLTTVAISAPIALRYLGSGLSVARAAQSEVLLNMPRDGSRPR